MANPMTAAQFLAALKAEGLNVRERKGWRTHNRNHKGAWGPLNGVMVHHTASGTDGIESFVSNGTDALPGPLCHGLIEKSGTVVAVGWGRANHAGGGDADVLRAVVNETWPVPKTNEHDGSNGSVDGNAHFVGYECVNRGDGKDPWPAIQLEAIARACAAVARHYGWTVDSVIRHMDWSDWKSDPRGVDWNKMRSRIADILAGKPNATPMSEWTDGDNDQKPEAPARPSKPAAPAKRTTVRLVNVIDAFRKDPAAPQGKSSHPGDIRPVEAALVKLGFLSRTYAADGAAGTKTVAAYNAFRRSLGMKGRDALGDPGRQSLSILGSRSGLFTVK